MTATLEKLTDEQQDIISDLEMIGVNVPEENTVEWTDDEWETAQVFAREVDKARQGNMHDTRIVAKPPEFLRLWMDTAAQLDPVAAAKDIEQDDADGRIREHPKRLTVQYGRASVGKSTVRLPFKVGTGAMSTQEARELLCERRLGVVITAGDPNGQKQFDGMNDEDDAPEPVEGTADTKGLTVSGGKYGSGLTFSRNDVDYHELVKFAEREGQVEIHTVQEIPKPEKKAKSTTSAVTVEPVTPDNWGREPVAEAMASHGLTEKQAEKVEAALKEHGKETTVRDLRDWINADDHWHSKIRGIGAGTIDKVSDALNSYYQANPEQEEGEDDDDGGRTAFDAEEENGED